MCYGTDVHGASRRVKLRANHARFISGRNSPDYSLGITDPHVAAATGRAVLARNSRINRAMEECEDLRIAFLVRNIAAKEFVLFEEAARFIPDDYLQQE